MAAHLDGFEQGRQELDPPAGFDSSSRFSPHAWETLDWVVLSLLVAFGTLQFLLYLRAKDFFYDDVFYYETARSLIQEGYYGISGRPEANQPPGLSGILALLCLAARCGYSVFLRAMVVFEMLGFIAAYSLLRKELPRLVAAAICLLLISSDYYFSQATQRVSNGFPYFCLTMLALLVAWKLDRAKGALVRAGWACLLAILFVASLLVASSAMALLGAVVVVLVIGFFTDRALAIRRLKVWLPALLLGLAVQGAWMQRKGPPLEWPLPGYPGSYLSQLKVKSGQNPELGMATLRDIPVRIADNALQHASTLAEIVSRHWIDVSWRSVFILGPVLLVALGWANSVWGSGGTLQEWYFVGYEFIYFLWPWSQDLRFVLPILPLACFYMWKGAKALVCLAKNHSRILGVVWTPPCAVLVVSTWLWLKETPAAGQTSHGGLQRYFSFAVWLFSGLLAAWIAWAGPNWMLSGSAVWRAVTRPISGLQLHSLRVGQALGVLCLVGFVSYGFVEQIKEGRSNLDLSSRLNSPTPDVLAAMWVGSHSDENAIVMARHVPVAYYYSHRKTVWFPPSTNASLLMEGIKRHKIDYIMVVDRDRNYYFPGDDTCFDVLFAAYPQSFRLVYQMPKIRVFLVIS